MMGRSSLAAGADRHLSGGAGRWFDARPLRPARPDCAKHMDDTAERLYRGVPTNLRRPSSLAGLQVRATRASSWPNVSVSGFAAQLNSSPLRCSDDAIQKI